MSSPVPPSDSPAQDELVAYLDGELSPEESRRLEERLAVDDDLRKQLQELDAAWEALRALPQPTVGDDFARTTIEMVAVAARRDVAERKSVAAAGNRKRWVAAAAVGLAAAACSFVAVRAIFPDTNRELVDDLPVIMQFDLLTQAQDVEFLRKLSQRVPLEQLVQDEEDLEAHLEEIQSVSTQRPEERGPWIEQQSPEEKAALAAHADRFRHRSDADELRQLEREIANAEDADVLQRTLLAYGQWLARRSPGEGAELRALSPEKRIREIEQKIARDDRHAARQLSVEDARRLRDEVYEIAEERKEDFLKDMRERKIFEKMRERGIRNPEERIEERDPRVARFIVGHALLWNKRIDDKTRRRLVGRLSGSAQDHLEKLGEGGQNWQLIRWMRESLEPKRGPEALERFFAEQLDNDQRAALLSLPPGEMETELERLYLTDQLGFRGREWPHGLGAPGEFDRDARGMGPPPWERGERPRDGADRERRDRDR